MEGGVVSGYSAAIAGIVEAVQAFDEAACRDELYADIVAYDSTIDPATLDRTTSSSKLSTLVDSNLISSHQLTFHMPFLTTIYIDAVMSSTNSANIDLLTTWKHTNTTYYTLLKSYQEHIAVSTPIVNSFAQKIKSNSTGSAAGPKPKKQKKNTASSNKSKLPPLPYNEYIDYKLYTLISTLIHEYNTYYTTICSQIENICTLYHRCHSMFEWQDGPLVLAMKQGDIFVLDEINLAEDAVIERLNSVLEASRTITLAEKGGSGSATSTITGGGAVDKHGTIHSECIIAHKDFKFLATMNPGGDFGKRELSPALRSRFTEIYVPPITDPSDQMAIITESLKSQIDVDVLTKAYVEVPVSSEAVVSVLHSICHDISSIMVRFIQYIKVETARQPMIRIDFSVRELLAWSKFISLWLNHTISTNTAGSSDGTSGSDSTIGSIGVTGTDMSNEIYTAKLTREAYYALVHGLHMIALDGLGTGISATRDTINRFKEACLQELISLCPVELHMEIVNEIRPPTADSMGSNKHDVASSVFTLGSFSIPYGPLHRSNTSAITTTTTSDLMEDIESAGQGLQSSSGLSSSGYLLSVDSTLLNLWRILRALQVARPILLEGPPVSTMYIYIYIVNHHTLDT